MRVVTNQFKIIEGEVKNRPNLWIDLHEGKGFTGAAQL
jgi:hypothetical protein